MKQIDEQYNIKVLEGDGRSSFLLNKSIVVDGGSLLATLEEKSIEIENIWLTHSHLDHIVDIAYIIDNYYTLRKKQLHIFALPQTIKALKENFLNDTIWPDFSKIELYEGDEKVVKYHEIEIGKIYPLSKNETIEAYATDHTIPSCGYIYKYKERAIAISSDTYSLKNIQQIMDVRKDINSLIVECSFSNNMKELAIKSKHLTAELLFKQLNCFQRDDFQLYINHIKPTYYKKIIEEIEQKRGALKVKILKNKEILHF